MRKLLDWTADKLGYERRILIMPQEIVGDYILHPTHAKDLLNMTTTQELLDDCFIPPMTESEKEFIDFRPIIFNGD